MREIIIKNDILKKHLETLVSVVAEIREINEKLQKLDKERNILGMKRQRILDKAKAIIEEENLELGEYEELAELKLKDNNPVMIIIDKIEEYKKFLKEGKD
ncbi:MAG: hypothetical protein CO103_01930, partial [Chloroflexi bacterium CG_4_9_14_3_um_filter_45_9]